MVMEKAPDIFRGFCNLLHMEFSIALLKMFAGFFLIALLASGCQPKPEPEKHMKADYIRKIPGPSDAISLPDIQRGEVLIAYSDCQECHTRDKRSKGPAFRDIAQRYPVNKGYILLLSQKIIQGGSGAWGKSVMLPHPKLSTQDAELMVKYILSQKP